MNQVRTLVEDLQQTEGANMELFWLIQKTLPLGSEAPFLSAPVAHYVMQSNLWFLFPLLFLSNTGNLESNTLLRVLLV